MDKFDLDIILFTHGPGAYAPTRLVEETNRLGYKLRIIKYNEVTIYYTTAGMELRLGDLPMPTAKGIFLRGLGEDSAYNPLRTALLTWFKSKKAKILNERSFDKWPSLDKTTQYINLSEAGIPVVDSFSFTTKSELISWSKNNYPYIAKDVIGSSGEGVYKISNGTDLGKLLKKFNSNYKVKGLLFQRFLPKAEDLRVVVLGGEIVGAMKRTALPGNFLSNYSQGGSVEPYNIDADPEAIDVALRTLKLFKLDYAGIDLMKNGEGHWIVLEVNRACQFEGFEKSTGINVAGKVAEFLAK